MAESPPPIGKMIICPKCKKVHFSTTVPILCACKRHIDPRPPATNHKKTFRSPSA